MKKIASFILICGFAAVSHAATTITGCVTDAAGKPVPGAKVFASPETAAEKTFRTEARKSDGCYELKIGKDGSYRIGVRDLRFADDGPTQAFPMPNCWARGSWRDSSRPATDSPACAVYAFTVATFRP